MVDDKKKKDKRVSPQKKIDDMMMTSAKPEVSDLISQRLRKFYNTVADQPVPDRFMDLLDKLEAASTSKKTS
jgi:Anti-sigma factor NepR